MTQLNKILTFWFGDLQDSSRLKPRKNWFIKDPAFDETVRQFQLDYEQAAANQLDRWCRSEIYVDTQHIRYEQHDLETWLNHALTMSSSVSWNDVLSATSMMSDSLPSI